MHFFRTKSTYASDDPSPHDHDAKESRSQRMEILVDNDCLLLRGTGSDSEPARLSGNIALYLTEPTTIRSITLQFRGKTYLPQPPQQSSFSSGNPPSTYIICKYNWSFLEGEKKHSHTLKAGRHLFPFQIEVGGSLPSSLLTDAFGGASVAYKLRAVAQRTGFSSNIQAVAPVYILRSLGETALEYQQTRDIEHMWMDKLYFYAAIPHVAWAAGDDLIALLKISPIVKGVGVLSLTTSLHETTKLYNRAGSLTRTVATVTHEIIGGRAVEVTEPVDYKGKHATPPLRSPTTAHEPEAGPSGSGAGTASPPPADPAQGEDDVVRRPFSGCVTTLHMRLPSQLTPSHSLDPISVSHSIHLSVFIVNADGHISELLCSLPVVILDSHLLNEARLHTRVARRLFIGGPEIPPETEDTAELPSYVAHLRDRVANMFLSDANALRVTNPWIQMGFSPIIVDGQKPAGNATSMAPIEVISNSNEAYVPDPEHPLFLDWVNAELFISQGATKMPLPSPSHSEEEPSAEDSTHLVHSDHPPTPPTPYEDGVPTYTHTSEASRALPGLFAPTMEPTSSLTHPNWRAAPVPVRPDSRGASRDVQRRVREVSSLEPSMNSPLLHRAFTEVPDYEVALRGFIGGVPPLSSMQGLPSYDEASRSGTPDLQARPPASPSVVAP
ncbi:hypothetical protein GGX14DRAFT_344039 [Mycena pura]|uniref:Arrestin C-terminal-like domain-containing protein n=1 Tax=Mycena pura TaxID=153505 RepID=A0AAD6YVM2_9AGAR|nr:hypothetical protein GGX14DRAFT_344039 [Mycena pura]